MLYPAWTSLQSPRHAFKEWSPVAEALRYGRQHLLLRKGGIAEGRAGFAFNHDAFWIFPTRFHADSGALRWVPPSGWIDPADPDKRELRLQVVCRVTGGAVLSSWDPVAALYPFHIYGEQLLRERFDQGDSPGLHLAAVRAFFLTKPWNLPFEKRFGGCRSWIDLPAPPGGAECALCPAVSDAEAESAFQAISALVSLAKL